MAEVVLKLIVNHIKLLHVLALLYWACAFVKGTQHCYVDVGLLYYFRRNLINRSENVPTVRGCSINAQPVTSALTCTIKNYRTRFIYKSRKSCIFIIHMCAYLSYVLLKGCRFDAIHDNLFLARWQHYSWTPPLFLLHPSNRFRLKRIQIGCYTNI